MSVLSCEMIKGCVRKKSTIKEHFDWFDTLRNDIIIISFLII